MNLQHRKISGIPQGKPVHRRNVMRRNRTPASDIADREIAQSGTRQSDKIDIKENRKFGSRNGLV
jgi:hypothetical protein